MVTLQSIERWTDKIFSFSVATVVVCLLLAMVSLVFQGILALLAGYSLTEILFTSGPTSVVGIFTLVMGIALVTASISYILREYTADYDRDLPLKTAISIVIFACGAATIRSSLFLIR
jgi:apolipoprotein N-acyltransferase